jgi:hypothetical protein
MSEAIVTAPYGQPTEGTKGENVRRLRMKGALTALTAAGVLTALLCGSVTAAHATTISVAAAHATPVSAHGTPISRANALRAARSYLRYQAFSLKGLIGQLKYEGYSTSDAIYGASHAGANWMKQAVRAAKQYLRYQPFSRSGMVAQLKYEGFTSAQALHGAIAAGL